MAPSRKGLVVPVFRLRQQAAGCLLLSIASCAGQTGLSSEGKTVESLISMGMDAEGRGAFQKALDFYSRVVQDSPGSAEARCRHGRALVLLERYVEAIKDLDEAIRLNPSLAPAYNNRGYAKNALKDHPGALADHRKATEVDTG